MTHPLDKALAEYHEAEDDYHGMWAARLRELQRLVMEERLANADNLKPAPRYKHLSDSGYRRVKHLLYALTDHLPIGTILTLVGEACSAVELGGLVMPAKIEELVDALAQQIDGP